MKGIVKAIIALIVAAATVTVGVVIVNNVVDSPRGTIEKFEESYNNLDIDSMIECFEPSVQSLYSGANSLLGDLTGFDISDMASIVPFIAEYDDELSMEDMPKIDIDIEEIDRTSDTTAVVYCVITASGGAGSEEDEIDMVKIDGEWYLSGAGLYEGL